MSVFDNLPSDSEITPDGVVGGPKDPNNTAKDMDDSDLPSMGKAQNKFSADLSGRSGQQQGASFADTAPEAKAFFMPTDAPGNGSGALTDNNGQGNSSGIPAAVPIEPVTFGNPNNSAGEFPTNVSGKL